MKFFYLLITLNNLATQLWLIVWENIKLKLPLMLALLISCGVILSVVTGLNNKTHNLNKVVLTSNKINQLTEQLNQIVPQSETLRVLIKNQ